MKEIEEMKTFIDPNIFTLENEANEIILKVTRINNSFIFETYLEKSLCKKVLCKKNETVSLDSSNVRHEHYILSVNECLLAVEAISDKQFLDLCQFLTLYP